MHLKCYVSTIKHCLFGSVFVLMKPEIGPIGGRKKFSKNGMEMRRCLWYSIDNTDFSAVPDCYCWIWASGRILRFKPKNEVEIW